jgi:hypothetical protein
MEGVRRRGTRGKAASEMETAAVVSGTRRCVPRYTDVNNKKDQGDSGGEGCLGTVDSMEV